MKKGKRLIGCFISILVVLGTVVIYVDMKGGDKVVVKKIHAVYRYDVSNYNNLVSDADYVFVAKVNKKEGIEYKHSVKMEDKWVENPYTKYNISVVKNIKGRIKSGKNINVLKAGGKAKESNVIYIYENDTLLKKGGYYICMAYVQQDGSLLIAGANSSINVKKNYISDNKYKKILNATKKGEKSKRYRYKINKSKI